MMSRAFLLVLASIVAGCGGAIEPPADGDAPPVSTLASSTQDAPPFGVWELVSLERNAGIATEVHDVLQLDLRADGGVTARRCGKTYYEPGSVAVRCADAASYDCFYGTVTRDGDSWRIELPDMPSSQKDEQGIVEHADAGIKVRYIMPTSPAGHFIRVPDVARYTTSSSSTVGNCKGS